jgi:hypothetical protein
VQLRLQVAHLDVQITQRHSEGRAHGGFLSDWARRGD